jgi:hypothetical protein
VGGCRLGDRAVVEDQPGFAGALLDLGHVAGIFEDGDGAAEGRPAGLALERGAVGIDDAGLEAFEDAFAGFDGLGGDGLEEADERLVVKFREEGFGAGCEEVAVAGPTGAAALGLVVDEALRFEGLEVLASGADGEKAVGRDLFGGGGVRGA